MTYPSCSKKKHTPIVTEKQRGFFGAEYRRGKKGKSKKTGMSQAVLKRHLSEAAGKELPQARRLLRIKKNGK